ncbi:hypothetical protein OC834_000502 [Tilletia horrida]|uniref:Ribosomal protein S15 n=1 Tax=Tilletia horrida TaxID=155126 RepID=A0AAN6GFE9_9BASI|nr:hypothetical protein OC835_006748 [Tilletia horrida]KAK0537675.1 hypothetical protein OC842_001550 [Tilletia horrida]KAK0538259.1 hypothetical protein OC834_000502 [Tilletia horrida]KAK0566044.1 hypothetical protein OC844_000927 [Tilletia horrida]
MSVSSSCVRCASLVGRTAAAVTASSSAALIPSRVAVSSTSSAFDLSALRTSLLSGASSARPFSQSAPQLEKRRKRQARLKRKSNLERRDLTARLLASSKPDPILGHMVTASTSGGSGAAAQAARQQASVVNRDANAEAIAAGLAPTTGGKEVWTQCELARLILSHDEVWGVREDRRGELVPIDASEFRAARGGSSGSGGGVLPGDETAAQEQAQFGGPLRLNFGLKAEDRELLFSELPRVMVEDYMMDSANMRALNEASAAAHGAGGSSHLSTTGGAGGGMPTEEMQKALMAELEELERAEAGSVDVLARVLDLRNASARGIRFENTRRIVAAFGRPLPDGRVDSGNTEVQVALLTYRIRNMYSHLANARHDNHNRRQMNIMVHQRAKLLKYLKRTEPQRYQALLPRVGLLPRAVEGELVLPGKPKVSRM